MLLSMIMWMKYYVFVVPSNEKFCTVIYLDEISCICNSIQLGVLDGWMDDVDEIIFIYNSIH
jgi:hypothetical protein